jgi:CHAT domain-containing protein/Tfp pilus assembly protein PilF
VLLAPVLGFAARAQDTSKVAQAPTQTASEGLAEAAKYDEEVARRYCAGQYAEAEAAARRAVAIRERLQGKQHAEYASSVANLALMRKARGDYPEAKRLFEEAVAVQKNAVGKDRLQYAATLGNYGMLLQDQGEFAQARAKLEEAHDIVAQHVPPDDPALARCKNNLASFYQDIAEFARAKALYLDVLRVRKKVFGERSVEYATALNNLASLLEDLGEYTEARTKLEQALEIQKQLLGERHPSYLITLNNVAHLHSLQGDDVGAKLAYERVLALRKAALGERHPDIAISLNNLAAVHMSLGDYALARPFLEQALKLARELLGEKSLYTIDCLNNLAALAYEASDYDAAVRLLSEVLRLTEETQGTGHPNYASALNSLAWAYMHKHDYLRARDAFKRARDLREKHVGRHSPDYASSLVSISSVLMSMDEVDSASRYLKEAQAIFRDTVDERHPYAVGCMVLEADLHWKKNEFGEAEPLLYQVIERTLDAIELAAAVESEREQIGRLQHLRDRLDSYLSLTTETRVNAERVYRLVLRTKGAVLARQLLLHRRRRVLKQEPQDDVLDAFTNLEKVSRNLATVALTIPDAENRAAWARAVAALTAKKESLEAELSRRNASFRSTSARARIPSQLAESLAPDTALVDFLVYTRHQFAKAGEAPTKPERRLLAFVVRKDRPVAEVDLGRVDPIAAAVEKWRAANTRGGDRRKLEEAGELLRKHVWLPLEPKLAGVQTLLVSPDGPLDRVPLCALPGRKPNSFLIEEFSISVVPVPQLLEDTLQKSGAEAGAAGKPAPASLLVVGDVDFGPIAQPGQPLVTERGTIDTNATRLLHTFSPLPATRGEILAVRDSFEERFAQGPAKALRGRAATEAAVRELAPQHRYLHLATHGFFAPPALRSALQPPAFNRTSAIDRLTESIDPFGGQGVAGFNPGLLSGVAFAGANLQPEPGKDDGILTALEVADLDLSDTNLVVLSACETGLGEEVAGGEGLLGLERAFHVAGADSVVATLWKVADKESRDLMERFYENLWKKQMPPREALRAAQLWMLKEGPKRGLEPIDGDAAAEEPTVSPYYWAAFVLSGEGG